MDAGPHADQSFGNRSTAEGDPVTIKTLKREEIYANEYENLEDLREHVGEFIERYYNQTRLHSALGYRSPDEFEQQASQASEAKAIAPTVRFFPESREKASTGMTGEGTQTPSLPQAPTLLGESTR
ncbi:MAG: integrase core domain-containing protein [Acidobacteriia bacterium]|nr:integrase core domain-containing protein [Terriglobia bacterium]